MEYIYVNENNKITSWLFVKKLMSTINTEIYLGAEL